MKKEKNSKNDHLPMIGVGPFIVIPQIIVTALGILLSRYDLIVSMKIEFLKIPFAVLGLILIVFGVYMWCSAVFKVKVDDCITENRLATNGVYRIVRNPLYSAFFFACIGAILIANNIYLLVIPCICWIYMTFFLISTEEKWLLNLYGQEYLDYCKKVNRCIPWFKK